MKNIFLLLMLGLWLTASGCLFEATGPLAPGRQAPPPTEPVNHETTRQPAQKAEDELENP